MQTTTCGRGRWKWYALLLATALAVYAMIWIFTERTPLSHSVYNSYALQAQSWLEGRLDLGQDYSWLELAVYKGKYYVSFPPLPSVLELPWVLAFGAENTPDYLLTTLMGLAGIIYMFRLFGLFFRDERRALLWTLLSTVGSNFLLVSWNGDVWLMAQTGAFMFTSAALYRAATDDEEDGKWPLLWLACAVGCRPFNILYLPVVAWLLARKFRNNGLTVWAALGKHWAWLIAPACVGGFYMALNYARFGNPFQFGHDFLPEYTAPPAHRQFDLANIPIHLREKLFALPRPTGEGTLGFPMGGFAFFIASPIYGVGFVCLARRVVRRLRGEAGSGALPVALVGACVSLHLLALCAHSTMGGVQWGLRYTVDAIPAAALGIGLLRQGGADDEPALLLLPALAFGLCLNLVGTLAIINGWSIFV